MKEEIKRIKEYMEETGVCDLSEAQRLYDCGMRITRLPTGSEIEETFNQIYT